VPGNQWKHEHRPSTGGVICCSGLVLCSVDAFLSANQCTVVHDRACIYASTWRRGPCEAHLRCGRSTQLRIASINDLPTKRASASITGCWVAVPLARGCGACRPGRSPRLRPTRTCQNKKVSSQPPSARRRRMGPPVQSKFRISRPTPTFKRALKTRYSRGVLCGRWPVLGLTLDE
jgi:hypothetical protein